MRKRNFCSLIISELKDNKRSTRLLAVYVPQGAISFNKGKSFSYDLIGDVKFIVSLAVTRADLVTTRVNRQFTINPVFSFPIVTENATKFCRADGTWEKSVYDSCINSSSSSLAIQDVEYTTLIYGLGYSFSIFALSLAVIIFLHFK